jgi:high-affinity nickel permease
MQGGKQPVAVGFFSLGHSTVVLLLSVLVALSAAFVKTSLPTLQSIGASAAPPVSHAQRASVSAAAGRAGDVYPALPEDDART